MAKRDDSAEEPAQKQHRGCIGCLVIFGVFSLIFVGIVYAPDRVPESALPATNSTTRTLPRSETQAVTRTSSLMPQLSPSSERTFLPSPTRTFPPTLTPLPQPTLLPSITRAAPVAEEATATKAISSTRAFTSTLAATRVLFATNTPYPLLIITNTAVSGGE
jgi:hypothetical protein